MDGAGGDRSHRRVAVGGASPPSSLERSCNTPMVPAMNDPPGWADLPDSLLQSIASLLVSFPDLLAFAATCPSWRAAFSSYPLESGFSSLLPPLLIQPDVPLCSPRPRPCSSSLVPRRPCYVTNLASQDMYMCCQIPIFGHLGPWSEFRFIGASYGHLILTNDQSCLVFDVFTGVSVPSPQLPVNEDTDLFYGALTAPLASPNSHLMVTTGSHNLFWRIGSHCWVRCSTHDLVINRVVAFKGQIFGMGHFSRLYIVHLVPHIHIQEMAVDCGDMLHGRTLSSQMFLVVCGDMLLMISCPRHFSSPVEAFQAFRLDLSAEPAKWVKVEKLEKWAIFISNDDRSQVLCCTDSERWGGRSNCIYCYDSKERVVICELGKQGASVPIFKGRYAMQPMWAVPSMIYSCR